MRRGKLSEEVQGKLPEAGGSDWAKVLSQDQIPRSCECVCDGEGPWTSASVMLR